MCAKHYENPTMLSRVTAKNVGDVFFETNCSLVFSVRASGGSILSWLGVALGWQLLLMGGGDCDPLVV